MSPLATTDSAPVETVASDPIPVYFAGPIDYIEHRAPGDHLMHNWRHRFFGGMPITLLCPTCLNAGVEEHAIPGRAHLQIMENNRRAMHEARLFVGYFPGDVATFGTPVEVWEWAEKASFLRDLNPGLLIHPPPPGVFVKYLEDRGVTVVRRFDDARSWLSRQLREMK